VKQHVKRHSINGKDEQVHAHRLPALWEDLVPRPEESLLCLWFWQEHEDFELQVAY
jgi:hypothetical protein